MAFWLRDARVFAEALFAGAGGAPPRDRIDWLMRELEDFVEQAGPRVLLILVGGLHHRWHTTGALDGRRHLHFPLAVGNRLDAAPTETVTVTGPLCAPHDVFAHDVPLSRAEAGDLIAVFQSGAYGPSASPGGFLGRPGAVEMLA